MSLLRKGAISRRGGLPTFKPVGLTPQLVADDVGSDWATGDIMQRKVFYDGSSFFVFWWNGSVDLYIKHKTSADGVTWSVAINDFLFSIGPGGNTDTGCNIDAKLSGFVYVNFIGSDQESDIPRKGTIADSSVSWDVLFSYAVANVKCVGGNVCFTIGGRMYFVKHGRHAVNLEDHLILEDNITGYHVDYSVTNVPPKSSTTGGLQILAYKSSSPYDCIVILKDANNLLLYTTLDDNSRTLTLPMTELGVTLASGFNSFSAASEAMSEGDPEIIHVVYIKSSGELCYRKFESDAWGIEKVLVASGATYPVIACGASGKLYVFYVKDGKIWVIHFNGSHWLRSVELFTEDHTYNTPTYLSTNQNVQSDKICLVWTEGTATPYEVWFCYLED